MSTSTTTAEITDEQLAIENALVGFFNHKIVEAEAVAPEFVDLWKVTSSVVLAGGKRFRPKLFIKFLKLYGGGDIQPHDAITIGIALELLHASFLVHDDIMDNQTVRHLEKNVTGKYIDIVMAQKQVPADQALKHANNVALLAGDLLLMASKEVLKSTNLTEQQRNVMYNYVDKAIFDTAAGQLLDEISVLSSVIEAKPEKIIQFKTTSYSLTCPILAAAELCGVAGTELTKLTELANYLGYGFQLVDDLLGSFGDEETTGKSASSDIIDGKRTLLLQKTYVNTDEAGRRLVDSLLSQPADYGTVTKVKELMVSTGAKAKIESEIDAAYEQSLHVIETLSIQSEHKTELILLAQKLTKRNA